MGYSPRGCREPGTAEQLHSHALLITLRPLTVWITTNWQTLKEMGLPDYPTCLLRNLYTGQEATVRTRHGTTEWFQIGKGVYRQGCILPPSLFNLYAETSCEMLGWMKHKLESRLPGEISATSDMQMTPPLWQKVMKVKEKRENRDHGIWSHHFMADRQGNKQQ